MNQQASEPNCPKCGALWNLCGGPDHCNRTTSAASRPLRNTELAYPVGMEYGLTKRELFAAMAMQGMYASDQPGYQAGSFESRAESAVKAADALLKELAK